MNQFLILIVFLSLGSSIFAQSIEVVDQSQSGLKLSLPTDNTALYDGKPEEFYMYVDRWVDGKNLMPWSGGQYGFVRNLVKTDNGIMATKFHEGIDIKPMRRDSRQEPLDQVRTMANGTVVYVNSNAARSNFGKYIVIQHNWGNGPFYSLYAHLSEAKVTVGQRLTEGTQIGVMGYTGDGIDRTRAHVHVELCMLLSDHFNDWFRAPNPHGLYHGHNLAGLDIASLLLAQHKRDDITIPDFQKGASPYYKVTVPRAHVLQITQRYPWLKIGDHDQPSPSWEISFTDSGLPLSVAPSNRIVSKPTVSYVRATITQHGYFTSRKLTGSGRTASLTPAGLRYLSLITQKPIAP